LFALTLLLSLATTVSAQDVIHFLNGSEVSAIVLEISSTEVRYRRVDNPDGPVFSTPRSELFMIKYANGTKEMMSGTAATPATQPETPSQTQPEPSQEFTSGQTPRPSQKQSAPALADIDPIGKRTYDENMRIARKKVISGAVLTGIGMPCLIASVPVLYYGSLVAANPWIEDGVSDIYVVSGVLLLAAGLPMTIIGAVNLGSSGKYRRRAKQLMGTASVTPAILRMDSYHGGLVDTRPGYGITATYKF
jgi:hypothetical protein